eukprot:CAMPEP_0115010688 /NCGR_PEP_ID=MMETSP0216-20121206/23482_1 /TAXON_ID=223996 /ORGANISM="Protocruzia adherens, Strain Boccale" /LENGTH=91 /DNA_ID=CAMNT_0002378985 /DNA_START=84 /DNA_END=356 /DNA_ORIENTATION=-
MRENTTNETTTTTTTSSSSHHHQHPWRADKPSSNTNTSSLRRSWDTNQVAHTHHGTATAMATGNRYHSGERRRGGQFGAVYRNREVNRATM